MAGGFNFPLAILLFYDIMDGAGSNGGMAVPTKKRVVRAVKRKVKKVPAKKQVVRAVKHKVKKVPAKKQVVRAVKRKAKKVLPKRWVVVGKVRKYKTVRPGRRVVKVVKPKVRIYGKAVSKGRITYTYYNRFGRRVLEIGDASEIRFYRDGKRYGTPFPAMEARMNRPDWRVVRPLQEGYQVEAGYEHIFRFGWNPAERTLRSMLTNRLGRRLSGMDVGNIVVTVGSKSLGIFTMSEITVRRPWDSRYIRYWSYRELIYKILQNVRAMGGNTSADRLKTVGEVSAGAMGYPLPTDYTVEVWVRTKDKMEPELL